MKSMAAVMSSAPRTTSTTSRIATGNSIARLLLSSFLLSSTLSSGLASAHQSPAYLPQHPILPPSVPLPDEHQHLTRELDLQLKHVFHHGLYKYPRMHRRLDVAPDMPLWVTMDDHPEQLPAPQLRAKSAPLTIQRLADRGRERIDALLEYGRMSGQAATLSASDWTMDEIAGPNITDQETVISFARMAANAYVIKPPDAEWEEVGGGFNYTEDFGWETDGLRGHIFADTENSTVVIALKGTSPAVFDGSETTTNDKVNDNLFFSCCCGQGGQYLWKQVCDCQTGRYQCNSTCLVKAIRKKNRYYYAAQDLYHNVTAIYPNATIWLAGHSLGGAVSSLLGLTVGVPSVTFEAVPEAMPAARLGLPVPPGDEIGAMHQRRKHTGGFHFGHTADPIFMGTCNSASSFCTLGGYALQSQCHAGMKCTYDTVKDFGWRVGVGTHKIHSVINDVILKYNTPPQCIQYSNCTDCYLWSYHEGNGTETTTSTTLSKTSSTRTRTQTCKTPGWWGCLDETTTGTATTTTTTSSSTSTCKTPGWFGCKDPITTTTTSTTSEHAVPAPSLTSATATSSSSCDDPGWFGGCHDSTSQSSSATPRPTVTSPTKTSGSTTCTSKEWFGLICVDPSPAGGQLSASISSSS